MSKQLYRSQENKIIGGVCGGLAEYFNIDPVIVRLVCVLLFFAKAIGIVAYIICMIIIPEAPYGYSSKEEAYNQNYSSEYTHYDSSPKNNDERNKTILGLALIGLGVYVFAKKFFHWFDFVNFGGIILILVGLYIVFSGKEKDRE